MARTFDIDADLELFLRNVRRAIQSARLNFLIGAGCSYPALAALGDVEAQVHQLYEQNNVEDAESLIFDFLKPFLIVSCKMIGGEEDAAISATLENYKTFLGIVSDILFRNANNILPKQANIFSTNYDLFVELAAEETRSSLRLADGFVRGPLIAGASSFSTSEFFTSTYNNGHSYNYRVEIPTVNLVKLHGSLTWERLGDGIKFSVSRLNDLRTEYETRSEILAVDGNESFNRKFCLVLPRKHEKFRDVLLTRTYYEMLRLYANQLDRENALLITEGVSFADEHILGMTQSGLHNPTLQLIIFCYTKADLEKYVSKFEQFNNVQIVYSESEAIDFARFNSILKLAAPTGS
jgi:hypothetical protein